MLVVKTGIEVLRQKSKVKRNINEMKRRSEWPGMRALLGGDDEAPEEKLVAMGETKEASSPPLGRGFAFAAR